MTKGIRIAVRLTPKAGQNAISAWQSGPNGSRFLKAWVAAPPEHGKANDALIRILAAKLHVPRSRIQIVSGAASRIKLIEVQGLTSLPAAFGEEL